MKRIFLRKVGQFMEAAKEAAQDDDTTTQTTTSSSTTQQTPVPVVKPGKRVKPRKIASLLKKEIEKKDPDNEKLLEYIDQLEAGKTNRLHLNVNTLNGLTFTYQHETVGILLYATVKEPVYIERTIDERDDIDNEMRRRRNPISPAVIDALIEKGLEFRTNEWISSDYKNREYKEGLYYECHKFDNIGQTGSVKLMELADADPIKRKVKELYGGHPEILEHAVRAGHEDLALYMVQKHNTRGYGRFSKKTEALRKDCVEKGMHRLTAALATNKYQAQAALEKMTATYHKKGKDSGQMISSLVTAGAKVNKIRGEKAGYAGMTALAVAVGNSNFEVCQALIDAGANVDQATEYGQTPIFSITTRFEKYSSINKGDAKEAEKIVEFLVQNGANINHANQDGNTVLHSLCAYKHKNSYEIVKILAANGANLEYQNAAGQTPLLVAVTGSNDKDFPMDNKKAAKALVELGANPNARDNRGNTPLRLAAGNSALVKILTTKSSQTQTQTQISANIVNLTPQQMHTLFSSIGNKNKVKNSIDSQHLFHALIEWIVTDMGDKHYTKVEKESNNYINRVRMFLNNGASLTQQDSTGETVEELIARKLSETHPQLNVKYKVADAETAHAEIGYAQDDERYQAGGRAMNRTYMKFAVRNEQITTKDAQYEIKAQSNPSYEVLQKIQTLIGQNQWDNNRCSPNGKSGF